VASYETHRMLQGLFKTPGLIERLQSEPAMVFEEYRVPPNERQALLEKSPEAYARVGIHPILQIHLVLVSDPTFARRLSANEFIGRLQGS